MSPRLADRYWQWVIACTLGEIIGFGGVPVLGAALVLWLSSGLEPAARSILLYATAAIGGLGEGAILALFQLRVLRTHLPRLNARRWILFTAAAAAFAWLCGMLAPLLDDLLGLSASAAIAIWIPAGISILLSIGAAQAWVLRDVVDSPNRWITANVLGWLLGLPWTFVLPALLPDTAPIPVWVATFAIAGIMMGLTVGLVTGRTLISLQVR